MTDALSPNTSPQEGSPREPWTAEDEDHAGDDLPPLDDPYLHGPSRPQKPIVSGLATTSVVAPLVLPLIGGIAGIVFGVAARREIDASGGRITGRRRATVGMVLGVVATLLWGAVPIAAWLSYQRAHPPADEQAAAAPDPVRTASPAQEAPPDPVAKPSSRAAVAPGYVAPKTTTKKREGAITLVDVGVSATSLSEALAEERAEASRAGETMLVMTTAGRCDPCRGVDTALRDPLMQTALARVRLVRVDTTVFAEDLHALKIPSDKIPGFFLLGVNLTPRDGIDGGEWDDDIAQNIAPVLGAFVRGKYPARREAWKAVSGSGMRL